MDSLLKITPLSLFQFTVFISLFNAGIVLLSEKWGFSDFYSKYRKKWMPRRCEFCACFWLACIEMGWCYFYLTATFDLWMFLMVGVLALCSAVLSRFVL